MNKTSLRRFYYRLKHRYLTMNNIVVGVALVIAASWAWGAVGVMQRNFAQQKALDDRTREEKLLSLEIETMKYQKRYYESNEYKELSAREHLGLASPGEKVLVLPENSPEAKAFDTQQTAKAPKNNVTPPSNSQQWVNFLLGGNAAEVQD